jgi:hypothetical protein
MGRGVDLGGVFELRIGAEKPVAGRESKAAPVFQVLRVDTVDTGEVEIISRHAEPTFLDTQM